MIPSETIAGDRAYAIATAVRAAAFDDDLLRVGEPQEGWQRARVDPMAVVDAAPGVTLGERWKLVAHQWYREGDGIGVVFAVPIDAPDASPVLHDDGRFDLPASAASSLSVTLYPSGSEESFLARGLLLRELHEIGALWHGARWGNHDLVTGPASLPDDAGSWAWEGPAPESFDPVMEVDAVGNRRVTFFTRTGLGSERIVEHADVHRLRDGSVTSSHRVVAHGTGGWVP